MRRLLRVTLAIVPVVLFVSGLVSPTSGRAASARTITASARCLDAVGNGTPTVEVTIENRTGASVSVGYVHGFTTPQAFSVLMSTADPGPVDEVTIKDGADRTVLAPWDDLR